VPQLAIRVSITEPTTDNTTIIVPVSVGAQGVSRSMEALSSRERLRSLAARTSADPYPRVGSGRTGRRLSRGEGTSCLCAIRPTGTSLRTKVRAGEQRNGTDGFVLSGGRFDIRSPLWRSRQLRPLTLTTAGAPRTTFVALVVVAIAAVILLVPSFALLFTLQDRRMLDGGEQGTLPAVASQVASHRYTELPPTTHPG
jgi:hypothetical protein